MPYVPPATGLQQIANAVTYDLVNAFGVATLQSFVAARFVANSQAPAPRLVWVPRRSIPGPIRNMGTNPHQVVTRRLGVEIHVWGQDPGNTGSIAETDVLVGQVIASCYRVCFGYFTFEDEEWTSETGSINQLGSLVHVNASFDLPCVEPPYPSAILNAVDIPNPNPPLVEP